MLKIIKLAVLGVALSFTTLIFAADTTKSDAVKPAITASVVKTDKSAEKVNINSADEKALASVKGIGKKKAKTIVDYRIKNGNFKSVDDLKNVKGIKQKWLDKHSAELTV